MKKHIIQFFKFLEDKEGKPAPLRVKLLNPKYFELTKEELNIRGDLNLSRTDIKELPKGLKVSGNLELANCTSLEKLPQGLKVGNSLYLSGCTSLKELPQGLKVDRNLDLFGCTSLKELPQDIDVGYSLNLKGCTSLEKLPQDLEVVGDLNLAFCTSLKKLPQGLKLNIGLELIGTPIAEKHSEKEIRKMIEDGGGYVEDEIYI